MGENVSSAIPERAAASPGRSIRDVGSSVFLNCLLSNFGYYTLLPMLPLLLTQIRHASPWFVGTALFVLGFAVRAACLPMSGLLHRTGIRAVSVVGLLMAAIGFGLLATTSNDVATLAILVLAGAGISMNTMTVRAYVALTLTSAAARNTAFSAVQVAVNLAAAGGPIASNLLFSGHHATFCLLLVAGLYAVAAAIVGVVVPPGMRPADHDTDKPSLVSGLRAIAHEPAVRRTAAIAVTGWFLYGQLFSAVTLHISEITASPLLRSSFFTADALLVVLIQIPVTAYATRRLESGTPPGWFLIRGLLVFGAAFGTLAAFGFSVAGTFVGITVFAAAETCFTPFVSTAFAEISATRPIIEAFVLLQIVMAVGEPLGGFSGGFLFSVATRHHVETAYWTGLFACALAVVAAPKLLLRSRVATDG